MKRCTVFLAVVILSAACSGDRMPSPGGPSPEPTPTPTPANETLFRVAILRGGSRLPEAGEVRRVFARANDILFEKTGQRMIEVDLATAGAGTAQAEALQYVNAHASAPPDGVLAFWDDATARAFGGYSVTVDLPAPHQNRYPSPVVGAGRVYVAVVHYFHMYARCGYDSDLNRIGTTSANGECRNRSGIMCVDNGRFWTCSDSLNDRYADPDTFTASTIVHEFMHPFGSAGNFDHYATLQCITRTGMSQADAQNLALAQLNCVMCPDLFQYFRR